MSATTTPGVIGGKVPPTSVRRPDDFDVVGSSRSLGRNLPQRIGRVLWLPMLIMAGMTFPVGIVLSAVRAKQIAADGAAETVAGLGQLVAGFMFLGFASVFAAVSFAIARIQGEFRKGGGEVQEAAGVEVVTLRMPLTARLFIVLMAVGMMTILGAVVAHFVLGASLLGSGSISLVTAEQWSIGLEGARRIGVAIYLLAITLGLATIITVLRFQSTRIREIAGID